MSGRYQPKKARSPSLESSTPSVDTSVDSWSSKEDGRGWGERSPSSGSCFESSASSKSEGRKRGRSCGTGEECVDDEEEYRRRLGQQQVHSGETEVQQRAPNAVFAAFVPISPGGGQQQPPPEPLRLTPYIVYQVFRGCAFPKKVVIIGRPSESRKETEEALAAGTGADGPRRSDGTAVMVSQTAKALLQFDSQETTDKVIEEMHNTIVRLALPAKRHQNIGMAVPGKLQGEPQVEYSFRLIVKSSPEGKVYAHKNNDRMLVVTPQCIHLLGPIMDRYKGPQPSLAGLGGLEGGCREAPRNVAIGGQTIAIPVPMRQSVPSCADLPIRVGGNLVPCGVAALAPIQRSVDGAVDGTSTSSAQMGGRRRRMYVAPVPPNLGAMAAQPQQQSAGSKGMSRPEPSWDSL